VHPNPVASFAQNCGFKSQLLGLIALAVLVSASCAAPVPTSTVAPQIDAFAPPAARPKVLTVGVQREPTDLGVLFGQGTATTAGGAGSVKLISHDKLAVEMELDSWRPQLGRELPSLQAGTWQLNPDGSMDTTWRIRPDVYWHDGTRFTSEDLLFSFKVFMDPDLPNGRASRRFAESATAPDPETFIVHWSGTYVDADQGDISVIRPKHILEELYLRDKDAFANSPWFTTEFIGLGPYRLVKWERGSHLEFARFDAYYQGRPPFDRIVVRFIGDPNALAANIIAGDLDVVLPVTVDLDAALDLRRRWEGSGNQVRLDLTGQLPQLEMQYRASVARPQNGFLQPLVRRAFFQAIDRNGLAEVMTQGQAPVADSWYPPSHRLRAEVEQSIPKYAYDPREAVALLGQAGWTRGADGILVHDASGERFEVELWGLTGQTFGIERQLSIIADGWKGIGAQVAFQGVPPSRLSDAQYVAEHPGPLFTSFAARQFGTDRMSSRAIPSATNRWSGFNRGGYQNARVDELFQILNVTIDPAPRLAAQRELVQELMGNVVLMPLYWEIVPTLMVKGVTGPKHVGTDTTRNIFEWDRT
jgi:peptide/nickel transport system substrate-binding protein